MFNNMIYINDKLIEMIYFLKVNIKIANIIMMRIKSIHQILKFCFSSQGKHTPKPVKI